MAKLHSDISSIFFKLIRITTIAINCSVSTLYLRLILLLKNIKFGTSVKFYGVTYFYRSSKSKIILGNKLTFRSDRTSNLIGINHKCIIATLNRNSEIIIGDGSGFSGVSIGASKRIQIGKNVKVGANCVITDTNWHGINPNNRNDVDAKPGEIVIEDNVFIGYGCIILKNVKIGRNSVIGAGSVVTSDIPENVIASGNPCKVIRSL